MENLHNTRRIRDEKSKWFKDVEGAIFRDRGSWADSEIKYKGVYLNYDDIADIATDDGHIPDEDANWEDAILDRYYEKLEEVQDDAQTLYEENKDEWLDNLQAFYQEYDVDILPKAIEALSTIKINKFDKQPTFSKKVDILCKAVDFIEYEYKKYEEFCDYLSALKQSLE